MDNNLRDKLIDQALICESLEAMLGSGIPILDVFETLSDEFVDYRHKLRHVRDRVAEGKGIAFALDQYDQKYEFAQFTPGFNQMIDFGESHKFLGSVLNGMTKIYQSKVELADLGADDKTLDKHTFYSMMAGLIDVGIPVLPAFKIIEKSVNSDWADVVSEIHDSCAQGYPTVTGIKKHPDYFTPFEIGFVGVGEQTGSLDDTAQKVAESYGWDIKLQDKPELKETYDKMQFFYLFSKSGGLQLQDALEVLGEHSDYLPNEVMDLISIHTPKRNLGEMVREFPKYFSGLDANMIAAGEHRKELDKNLEKLSNLYKRELELKT